MIRALTLLSVLFLAACQVGTEPDAAAGTRLSTQASLAAITGKTLTFKRGQTVKILPNGTLTGSWDGAPVRGTYEMRDGFFCRTLTAGPNGRSPEDCQVFVLKGKTLNVTRDRGRGSSFDYRVG